MEKLKILLLLIKNQKTKGVTILELIITIGILSMLLLLVMINTNLISNRLAETELKIIERSINTTRNMSISSRTRHKIEFQSESVYYTSYNNETNELKELKINFTHPLSNKNSFTFTEKGSTAYDGSGTIILEGKNESYSISVTPAVGKVNVRKLDQWKEKLKDLYLLN